MWRRSFVVLLAGVLLAPSAFAKPKAKPLPKRLLEKTAGPKMIELESADVQAATATVILRGITRPPESRLFMFHDDRNRHFIALDAHCAPVKLADGNNAIRCVLDMPRPYLSAAILGLTMRVRDKDVGVPEEQVIKTFEAAQAVALGHHPNSPSAAAPHSDGGSPP